MRTTIDFADDVLLVARGLACRDGINIGAVLRAAILAGAHRRHEEGDRIPGLRTGPSNPSAHVTANSRLTLRSSGCEHGV